MMQEYYDSLITPWFAPPSEAFGIAWSILYVIIFLSFGYVLYLWYQQKVSFMTVLPFLLNIVFNALFTPIQFWLQNNWLALIDIVLVVITLVWAMITIYKHAPIVMYAQIPYLLWVVFATILQASITYLNWGL